MPRPAARRISSSTSRLFPIPAGPSISTSPGPARSPLRRSSKTASSRSRSRRGGSLVALPLVMRASQPERTHAGAAPDLRAPKRVGVDTGSFLAIVATAALAGTLAAVAGSHRLFVPVVVVELVLGVIVGPQVLDLAHVNSFTSFFADLGLGMLFFFAGY